MIFNAVDIHFPILQQFSKPRILNSKNSSHLLINSIEMSMNNFLFYKNLLTSYIAWVCGRVNVHAHALGRTLRIDSEASLCTLGPALPTGGTSFPCCGCGHCCCPCCFSSWLPVWTQSALNCPKTDTCGLEHQVNCSVPLCLLGPFGGAGTCT